MGAGVVCRVNATWVTANLPSTSQAPVSFWQSLEQGKQAYANGNFTQAITHWLEAEQQLSRSQSASTAEADWNHVVILSNLGLGYQQLGQWPEATQALAKGLKFTALHRPQTPAEYATLGQILNTQGRLQLTQGKPSLAFDTWQSAEAAYRQAQLSSQVHAVRINQAQALQAMGLYNRALKVLEQLMVSLEQEPDTLVKAASLRTLGDAIRHIGDLNRAKQVFSQSLVIAQRLNAKNDIAASYVGLGNLIRTQPQAELAQVCYQQAAAIATSPLNKLQAHLNALTLNLDLGQWTEASQNWPQIQTDLQGLPLNRNTISAQLYFYQALMTLKIGTSEESSRKDRQPNNPNASEGPSFNSRGVNRSVPLTTPLKITAGDCGSGTATIPVAPPQPVTSLTPLPSWPEIAQQLAEAIRAAEGLGDQRMVSEAIGHLGRLYEYKQQWADAESLTQKALIGSQTWPELAYGLHWQLGRILKGRSKLDEAIQSYQEAIQVLQSIRGDLVATNPNKSFSFKENVEPIYRELVDLLLSSNAQTPSQDYINQARRVVEALQLAELDNFFRAACFNGKPTLIDRLVDEDDPTAAVIYPIVLADRVEVIVKLPQQKRLRSYKTMQPRASTESIVRRWLSTLTSPTERFSTRRLEIAERLYDWIIRPVVADLQAAGVKTLVFVLDDAFRNVPMAALYDGKNFLVENFAIAVAPGLQLLDPQPLKREPLKVLSAGITQSRQGLSALVNVGTELKNIKATVPAQILLDEQFTVAGFQKNLVAFPSPIVHLASHGNFSSNPNETYILAWDRKINVNDLPDLLTPDDVNQRRNIQLLVLSACQTARGDKRSALGLAGLALRSGARSTLGSLWRINDESASILMTQFYRELAQGTENKAIALQQAQKFMLKNDKFKEPLYWAAFVLVGNWL